MSQQKRLYAGPALATDIIIEYRKKEDGNFKEGIILITRMNFPYGFALPGGFAEPGLSFLENALKEAKEETNLVVLIHNPEKPFLVLSEPGRDPRGHIASIVYIAEGSGELMKGDDAKTAALYSLDEIENIFGKNKFAFDHECILKAYIRQKKKMKSLHHP